MSIAISGLAGSGKDTLADILIDLFGYEKTHFAWDLKNIAIKYFGWDQKKDTKGRHLLQQIGTELGRNFQTDLWLIKFGNRVDLSMPNGSVLRNHSMSLEKKLGYVDIFRRYNSNPSITKARLIALTEFGWDGIHDEAADELLAGISRLAIEYDPVAWSSPIDYDAFTNAIIAAHQTAENSFRFAKKLAVPDCRFLNEAEYLVHHGFVTVSIKRDGIERMNHASETSLDDFNFDVIIKNNGTLSEFRSNAERFMADYLAGRIVQGRGPVTYE